MVNYQNRINEINDFFIALNKESLKIFKIENNLQVKKEL